MGGVISSIEPGGIADELNWRVGDEIVSINGHDLHDIIDYQFYSSDELLTVSLRRRGKVIEYEIEKDVDLDLGVEFEEILFDGVRTCGAHCVFCFVEQLPRGLRKPLYLKDDDYRLSFLDGNFVTLANVTQEDLDRIVAQRLSPLYVSVHATEPDLRSMILGRDCPDILGQIDILAQVRIELHTQIVLCRGINDGDHLERTVGDLAERYPTVGSIAVVPAGVTCHRRHKTPIPAIDASYSASILRDVRQWEKRFAVEKDTRLIWAADEFYLNAGQRVPSASAYEGFPQIGNGVGLVRKFLDSARSLRRRLNGAESKPARRSLSLVTGVLAAPILRVWADSVRPYGLDTRVHAIQNRLFGETVTVAGLISGRDVIDQLRAEELGEAIVIPSVAIRDGAFLDDVTITEVSRVLGREVIVVEPLPHRFVRDIEAHAS